MTTNTQQFVAESIAKDKAAQAEQLERDNAIAAKVGARLAAEIKAKRDADESRKIDPEAMHRAKVEAELKPQALAQFKAAGGTADEFEAAWPALKMKLIEQSMLDKAAAARREHARLVRSMF